MIILILTAIFVVSFISIGVILCGKIPDLVKLPEASRDWQVEFLPKIKKGVGKLPGAKTLNYELYLQKILSRIRVLTLKTESKTGNWLEKLRQKSNHKQNHQPDTYWEELKKGKEGK